MTKHRLLGAVLSTFLALPVLGAEPLQETEFTSTDAIRLLNAKGWSFSYSPGKPVRRLDILIYEERTDQAGKTETTIRHSCMLGMLPKERVFPIKMLLVGNELHAMIDAAKSSIKVSEDFTLGAAEYRKTGDCKEDKNGRRFLIEMGNKNEFKGKGPFKSELKFKIFENLDQATLKLLLDGGQIPETAMAEQGSNERYETPDSSDTDEDRADRQSSPFPQVADSALSKKEADDPADGYFHAYLLTREAEKAANREESMRHLEEALGGFMAVKRRFPDWKTSLVDARIQRTQKALAALSEIER